MFSLLGKIFGTESALESVAKSGASAIDSLVYTDEERSTDAAKERAAARAMVVQWMQSTEGQNIARRLIALLVTAQWLLLYNVSWVLGVVSIWAPHEESQARLMATQAIMNESAQQMNGAVMLVLGFYFAAPHMGTIAEKAINRFSRKTTG